MTETIGRIYEAAIAPDMIAVCLAEFSALLSATGVAILQHDARRNHGVLMASDGIGPGYRNRLARVAARLPMAAPGALPGPGTVFDLEELVVTAEARTARFLRRWLLPAPGHRALFGVASRDGPVSLWYGAIVAATTGASGHLPRSIMEVLLPHIGRARALAKNAARAQALDSAAAGIVDQMLEAVLVVRADGRLVFTNPAGRRLLKRSTRLVQRHGRLQAGDDEESRNLAAAIREAASAGAPGAAPTRRVCLAGQEEPPLLLSIVPLDDGRAGWSAGRRPLVALVARDPAAPAVDLTAGDLKALFGLTRAESRVAQIIGRGTNLREAADTLGISNQTARTHMKRILQKAGVRRQAGLVHMLTTTGGNVGHTAADDIALPLGLAGASAEYGGTRRNRSLPAHARLPHKRPGYPIWGMLHRCLCLNLTTTGRAETSAADDCRCRDAGAEDCWCG